MNIVEVPESAIEVANTGQLIQRLSAMQGSSLPVDLFLSGLEYEEFGIFDYFGQGNDWMTLYCRPDGLTTVAYTGGGHSLARSAVIRVGSMTQKPVSNIRMRNPFTVDGQSFDDNQGAIWGIAAGGSYDKDPARTDIRNIDIEGPRIKNLQLSGFKFDGDGGSSNLRLAHFEISHTGSRYDRGETDKTYAEGLYIGDGNTRRQIDGAIIEDGWIHHVESGEGAEVKSGCTNVVLRRLLVEDVRISDGAAIKFQSRDQTNRVESCDVRRISVNSDSATRSPVGIQSFGGTTIVDNHVSEMLGGYCYEVVPSKSGGVYPVRFENNYADSRGAMGALRSNRQTFFGNIDTPIIDEGGNEFTGGRGDATGWREVAEQAAPSMTSHLPAPPIIVTPPPAVSTPPVVPTPTETPEGNLIPLIVRAKGDTGEERLELWVNGQMSSTIQFGTEYDTLPVVHALFPEGSVRGIELRFINDAGASNPAGDRNITIESVTLGNQVIPASDAILVDPDNLAIGYRNDGRLWRNASLLFPINTDGTVAIEAPEPPVAAPPIPIPVGVFEDTETVEGDSLGAVSVSSRKPEADVLQAISDLHGQLAAEYSRLASFFE